VLHLKVLDKQEQDKPKITRIEVIKVRNEINEVGAKNKETSKKFIP
jgi:hypothetical protein